MEPIAKAWRQAGGWIGRRQSELRLAGRVTVAGVVAFAIGHLLNLPQAYWAVFTAVIVMQASVGGSLKMAMDQLLGALIGGAYGAVVALAVPHTEPVTVGVALTAALAPLALLAALRVNFRVAPITAIIVLLGTTSMHAGPVEAALDRALEVALGGTVGIVVSLFVLPARAHGVLASAAGRTLLLLATLQRTLLAGLIQRADPHDVQRQLDAIRGAINKVETATEEARRERRSHLTDAPDPEPFLRTLLRLRHDLVMIRRTAGAPLPEPVASRLTPALARVSSATDAFMTGTASALSSRRHPPSLAEVDAAFDAYTADLLTLRGEGVTRALPVDAIGRLYAFSFALEQQRQNFRDMANRTIESAQHEAGVAPATPA
ncbi:FUSC family protein [Vineibacter terrae]|uniref:FUSC family protein n=1 Tax=Vineibacter terrae TaxID=2586908 RepID=A0A5C8PQL1_9HYPH|nr:FUSC family protein [Vineibacter terrae]TXL77664.1 FUSC family protein [Vineibacter terrae]